MTKSAKEIKPIKEIYYHRKETNSFTNKNHSHSTSYEILQIISGSGDFLLDGKHFEIKKNHIFLIDKAAVHCSAPNDRSYSRNIMNISTDYIAEISRLIGDKAAFDELFQNKHIIVSDTDFEKLDSLIKKANDNVENKTELFFIVVEILEFLMNVQSSESRQINSNISRAVDYIDKNLYDNLSLDEICSFVHMSKYYFCRLFKKTVGMSPFDYIISKRILQAKKLLTETEISVSEISEITGFNSFSSLCNTFKKSEGITPSQFRKRNKDF